jgi:hypothetical protein
MPVQMIELEEVAMVCVSDEYLEALRSPLEYYTTQGGSTCETDGENGCPW